MPVVVQEVDPPKRSLASLRQLGGLLWPARAGIAWAAMAVAFDALLTLCRPWPLKVVVDYVVVHRSRSVRVPLLGAWLSHGGFDRWLVLYGACCATLLIASGTGWFTYSFTRTMGDVGRHFSFRVRGYLFSHMQRLSLRFHDHQRTGDLVTRLMADVARMQDAIASAVTTFAGNVLLLLGMVVVMFWLDVRFALVSLAPAPLLFWAVLRYSGRIQKATRAARKSEGQLASLAQETLASIRIVQGLAQEDHQDHRFDAQNRTSLGAYLDGIRYQARVAPLVDLCAGGGLALVMLYGAQGVLEGRLTTGDVIVFFAYVTNLYAPMRAIARMSTTLSKALIGAERVAQVLEVEREVVDRPSAIAPPRLRGRIELDDVSFAYQTGQPVLSHVTLTIEPGEKVAIVGATGAGKSTLASLVPRLYDPTGGSVRIDGVDLRDYQLRPLREQVALVLQDALLFRGTIRDNIELGRIGASEAEIRRAAEVAQLHDFAMALPDDYDTIVGERGVTLSGGQRQRIAIARAVLRDAPILLLDEPTTGLDAGTEHAVVEALAAAARGRTTLVIAHRLSSVRFVDRIVVLGNGRILEQGSHEVLLAQGGEYARLWRHSLPPAEYRDDAARVEDVRAGE